MSDMDPPTRSEFNAVTGSLQRQIDSQGRAFENYARDTKDELRRVSDMLKENKAAPQSDSLALAMHRFADMADRVTPGHGKGVGNPTMAIGLGATIPVIVFLAWQFIAK